MSSAPSNSAATPLPYPKRSDRWQPLRSGVLNLFRYDYEEFHYEDGRLLLRGNNGSGKSRVLALQLPFLLDGEVSPARVEPDGDPAKRIEWNLLMGSYPERTGYTWIEFGRRDADGTCHFLTLGCGLRAVAGHSGLHSRWFFVTTQRIGRDLFLQTAQRIPLGKERLAEALGTAGKLWLKVEDYRRAVDEALFGLGPRYPALLELLLRLRRPQLSRKLDEDELSSALSDALPTLPSAIVDEVAESFQSLQADRERLREFTQAQAAVTAFLAEYRLYVRIAVRRRADAFRESHSAYEAAQREAKDAQTRFDSATGELSRLTDLEADLNTRLAGAEAAERTLRESPEMRTAQEVGLARTMADQTENASARAKTDEEASARAWDQAKDRQREMESQAADLARELGQKRKAADDGAATAELGVVHRQYLRPDLGTDHLTEPIAAENAIRRALNQRDRGLVILRERDQAVIAADRLCDSAAEELRRAEDAASIAREAEHAADEAVKAGARRLIESYASWRGLLALLQPEPPDSLAETLSLWIQQRTGPSPVRFAVEAAHDAAVAVLATREAALKQTKAEITAEIAEFNTAIDRLERGETTPPPAPPTRRSERAGRLGAPLWRLCDFRAGVSLTDRANLEAALQAAGLLDAWVMPDGRLLPEVEDEFLLAIAVEGEPLPHHLGEILSSSIDPDDPAASQVSVEGLDRLLTRIGLGEISGSHWIAADGRWQLGPLTGRATKISADYIGESTRAAARRRQLAELRTQRQTSFERRDQIAHELARVVEARNTAGAERAAAPSDESVVRAGIALEEAARRLAQTLAESERATEVTHARQAAREERLAERRRDAADLKLAAWIGRTESLTQVTAHYEKALAGLWPTERHWTSTGRQLSTLRQQALEAEAEHTVRRGRKDEASAAAEAARQRFETLQETHGQEISLILQKLAEATKAVMSLKGELDANRRRQLDQTGARAKAEGDRTAAELRRAAQDERRQMALGGLRRLVEQRLLAEADPALRDADPEDWTVTQTVDLVRRRIDPALTDTPDDSALWQRSQDAIHGHIQQLRDQLITHGHPPETHQSDEIILVRCVFQGRPHTMTELRDAFAAELEQRERLLQSKEREIIENHLLAEAAVELQKLIRAAESWRASANEELTARPTSSGVRFRFQWEPDVEIKFHEVRPALLRKGELWTPSERAAVATFLQGRIKAEQDADESASWKDQLAKALDYRRWHRFVVERQQDGQWRRLTRNTYGTGSSGEKALALTLPRFAAAAAHYRSAAKTAPRLVMLDEAFAGIDPTMRAQCMGVLTQFDLDVVMTSELEWGCYPTVPSLAIYHLTTLPGVDAVAATRWIWNGRERKQRDAINAPEAPTEAKTEAELHWGMSRMLDSGRLTATLGALALERLVDALERRMELGRRLAGPLTLSGVSAAERQAVDEILGRKSTQGDSLQIDLSELAQVLREAEICEDLESAVRSLRGPVVNRRALSAQTAEAWAALQASAGRDFANWPALLPWVAKLSSSGILRRLSGDDVVVGATLLRELALVVANLPAHAEPLPAFAARLFGNAHALDPGVPRATLAVRAAARWAGLKFDDNAEGRRSAWAGAGVMCDELSTPVLVFNLPASGDTPLAQVLRSALGGIEPVHLSLRMLLRWPVSRDPTLGGRDIYICENPTIVAMAASRVGQQCPPLICVNGQFATPALILLRQLRDARARLHYHGDFDLPGLQIARRVMAESDATPWRFGAADYLSAPKGEKFVGVVPATPWDLRLREVMRASERIVHEEAIFEKLAGDLLGPMAARS